MINYAKIRQGDENVCKSLTIDDRKEVTPSRIVKEGTASKKVYTDHNTMMLELN